MVASLMESIMYDDKAFVAVIFVIGFTILLVCWIAEYFCGGDK